MFFYHNPWLYTQTQVMTHLGVSEHFIKVSAFLKTCSNSVPEWTVSNLYDIIWTVLFTDELLFPSSTHSNRNEVKVETRPHQSREKRRRRRGGRAALLRRPRVSSFWLSGSSSTSEAGDRHVEKRWIWTVWTVGKVAAGKSCRPPRIQQIVKVQQHTEARSCWINRVGECVCVWTCRWIWGELEGTNHRITDYHPGLKSVLISGLVSCIKNIYLWMK